MIRTFFLISLFSMDLAALAASKDTSSHGWWQSINQKTARIFEAEARLTKLEEEYRALKAEYTRLESEHHKLRNQWEVDKKEKLSLQDTGSKDGVSMEAIDYQSPKGLTNDQLYKMALDLYKEKKFAQAGVILDQLTKIPEYAQNADVFYTSGVAWFRVNNYKKAKENFEAAKVVSSSEQKEKIKKKIDLWMRVIENRLVASAPQKYPQKDTKESSRMPASIPSIQPPSKHEEFSELPTEPKEVGSRPLSPEEAARHEDSSNHH